MKQTTLCYLIKDGQVLLATKKRGFAAGKINGPGGKIEEGETPEQACYREFFEETGSILMQVESRGMIEFRWEDKPGWNNFCHIFVAFEYTGEPQETEEMAPAWYPIDGLPFESMWEDDAIWLPGVLAGGRIDLRFEFDGNGKLVGHRGT